jgi:hypothetical protein
VLFGVEVAEVSFQLSIEASSKFLERSAEDVVFSGCAVAAASQVTALSIDFGGLPQPSSEPERFFSESCEDFF